MSPVQRRRFLALGVQLPLAFVLARSAGAACVDRDELPDSEQGMRESLEYTDAAQDSTQVCGGCSFFKSGGDSGCGHCEVLRGTVSATGHCVSWTKRS